MPKERRERSMSFDRSRLSPFSCRSSCPLEDNENVKEWEEARCPVCMEHPHNAILLICSSNDKGCRPFMCDTSYRHSNCFDQFRKSFGEVSTVLPRQEDEEIPSSASTLPSVTTISETAGSDLEGERSPERLVSVPAEPCEDPMKSNLVCPLCRGQIDGWTVVKSARRFMNAKSRSCACETCDYSGTYSDLRKHARLVHPLVRPTDADPERQRNWRRLERQRDLGDLLSTLQSSIGEERTDESSTMSIDEGSWLTVFLFVRFVRPARARARVPARRSSRRLWGETSDGEPESRDDANESSDGGQSLPRQHGRRRARNPDDDDNESSDAEQEEFPRRYSRRRRQNPENQ